MIRSIPVRLLSGVVHFYRYVISPMTGPTCRFHPTCSSYALEALQKHGAIKGSILTIKRVLRCQPFCKGGFDPVPDTKHDELKKDETEKS